MTVVIPDAKTESEAGTAISANTGLSQIPSIDKTPLSPVKEALCVALIWLLIAGIPLSFCYYIPIFPLVWAGQAFIESWLRKKYNIAFLPRDFLNWLFATHAWDIFVLRSQKNPKAASLKNWALACFFIGSGILYIVYLDSVSAAVDLGEMRKVAGKLEGWKWRSGRYTCGDTLMLRLEDGKLEKFRNYMSKEKADYYGQIKGQQVTVWLQAEPYHLNPRCRELELVRQLQHNNSVVGVPYRKERTKKVNRIFEKIAVLLFGIGLFCYLRIWRINRV